MVAQITSSSCLNVLSAVLSAGGGNRTELCCSKCSYLNALLQVSDVDSFCLKELCHDVPENMHRCVTRAPAVLILSVVSTPIVLTLSSGRTVSSRH